MRIMGNVKCSVEEKKKNLKKGYCSHQVNFCVATVMVYNLKLKSIILRAKFLDRKQLKMVLYSRPFS